ncbi:hypothetical protein EDD15DRAFT_2264056 [Pisolithus albus]|nr:hypothetical protein EDD15DRAFT_2264056 [Pisolithus albus]
MLENHHIDIDEEVVEEDEEEEDEEEDEEEEEEDEETIMRMLAIQQARNFQMVADFITLAVAAIKAMQTSSGESDDESSSHYSVVSPDKSSHNDHEQAVRSAATYDIRMQRVLLWRDSVMKSMSSSNSLPLKRRVSSHHDDNDNSSPSPAKPSKRPRTTSRPTGYKCSACSMSFRSQQSLHQHARMPQAHEACRVAVGHHCQ